MFNKIIAPLLVLGLLFGFFGCSENGTQADDPELFGDLTSVSEAIAFGDPVLITEAASEVSYDDLLLATPAFDSLQVDSSAGKYHLRVLWGQLRYDSLVTIPTEWDGSLTVSYGGIAVKRLIHWELNQDFLLPRTSRELVEWQSTTTVHNDGLAFDIFIPEPIPTFDSSYTYITDDTGLVIDSTVVVDTLYPEIAPVTIAFETGPYSRIFSLDELENLDTIVYLDDSNAVAFSAIKANNRYCARGMVRGHWGYDEEGNGQFRGAWRNRNGELSGFLKGSFEIDENGENIFVGKWIDENGNCEGFVRGKYRENLIPDIADHLRYRHSGQFVGKVYNAEKAEIGVIAGKFKSGLGKELGFFQARWRLYCPNTEGEEFGNENQL